MTTHTYEGGCHCGNLTYIFEASEKLEKLGLRVCTCSFCRKHGQRSASDSKGSIKVSVKDPAKLNRYRFGLNTTDFLICHECGVYIGAMIKDKDGAWMVVNVNTLRELPALDVPVVPHNFDAEDTVERIARRKKSVDASRQFRGGHMTKPAAKPERIVEREALPQEPADYALRPQKLADFIGQPSLCDNLKIFIEAAKQRQQSLDHVLLFGPPGLGKTTLAQIIARELGVNFRGTSGPVIARAGDLAALLTNLQPHDVLFIDEIHRLNPAVEEILYPAMEDFQLDLIIGEGPAARSVRIDLPPFTLIGATTRSGLITRPLRERFGIPLRLQFYSPEELQVIISCAAEKLDMPLTKEGAGEIARRARGTPRVAGRLLRRVRDFAAVAGHKAIDAKAADEALMRLEVDRAGFDAMDRRYLTIIAEHYAGGPVGIETLGAALSEQRDVLEEVIEPYLIQQGLLQRTPRGRMLAEAGYRHLGLTVPAGRQSDFLALSANEADDDAV